METLDHGSLAKRPILPIKERWTLMAVGLGVSLIGLIKQVYDVVKMGDLLARVDRGDVGAAYELMRMQREGVPPMTILMGLLGIASIVFICMWFYRASQNVHEAGMSGLTYTPGWAVGWFFIPLVHIVMPVLVIREMVKATQSISNNHEYDSWANNKPMSMFTLWAVCFCVRMLSFYVAFGYGMSFVRQIASGDSGALIDLQKGSVYISYFTIGLGVIELAALFMFSKKVTDLQEQYRKEEL